jgi:hypothetical protein
MPRFLKAALLIMLLSLVTGALFAQDVQASPHVRLARIMGIFVGYGTGQYILGENGTGFLVGDAIGATGIVAGYASFASSFVGARYYIPTHDTGLAILGGGAVVYLISRIWEIADLFRVRTGGTAGRLEPSLDVHNTSFEPGAVPGTSFEVGITAKL